MLVDKTVSFFTVCYEKDWEKILKENRIGTLISNCNFPFNEKVLIINNVKNRKLVEGYAIEAVNNKIIDKYYFSEDFSEKLLSTFCIRRKSFVLDTYDGYWYSIGPLSAVYCCQSKYLLYFTGDCMVPLSNSPWIQDAIEVFESNSTILTANPVWDNKIQEAIDESFSEDSKWCYSYGFSDQCFLLEKSRLYGDVYNYYHPASERYPMYGGNIFERRILCYMRCKNLHRITRKDIYYTHIKLLSDSYSKEVPKKSLAKKFRKIVANLLKKRRIMMKTYFSKNTSAI